MTDERPAAERPEEPERPTPAQEPGRRQDRRPADDPARPQEQEETLLREGADAPDAADIEEPDRQL
jgi:hypothetical protein